MESVWRTYGFEDFRRGECGNAGQNLYVSRAGVLQRIHQFDLNRDGYPDLIFCNSQNHWEKPPATVYRDIFGEPQRIELPSDGALAGAAVDLNGDGYDDLVLAMQYNGATFDTNAFVYYGAPDGWSERRMAHLPAPSCTAVAAGDFNGDGRPDLAFLCKGKLRLFYQTPLGLEPKRFVDLDIAGEQAAADDLDGDGYADLIVRDKEGGIRIYWGSPAGIQPDASTPVPCAAGIPRPADGADAELAKYAEWVSDAQPLVRSLRLAGQVYLFIPQRERTVLLPLAAGRAFGEPLILDCPQAMAAAVGDVNGDGYADLVIAGRQPWEGGQCSWVYWGGPAGFSDARRSRLSSYRACDVAVGDLDGDGCAEIVICQNQTPESFTHEARVYRGGPAGVGETPVRLVTEDARRAFIVRSSADPMPQVVFVNHSARAVKGHIPIYVYHGGPAGFAPDRRWEIPAGGAVMAIASDFDDDGQTELALINCSENAVLDDPGTYILRAGADGYNPEPAQILPSVRAIGAACADINRDGYLDLVIAGFDTPEILIFYGSARGFDLAHPQRIRIEYDGCTYLEHRLIYLADLNNDGWLDLVVPEIANDRSFVLWGGPAGFSMERCQPLATVGGCSVKAADLTGNGYLDLLIGGFTLDRSGGPRDSFLRIYWNGPEGLSDARCTLLPGRDVHNIAVADFNRDGWLDIFIACYHGIGERDVDSYIYWNRPGRGFSMNDFTRLFTHSASGCQAGDFNDDGWVDLAIAYHKVWGDHVGYSAVWWNGPAGFDERNVTILPTTGPHGMTVVDPGSIADRGPEETYTSAAYALPAGARPTRIAWQADIPPTTWVKAQLRCARSAEELPAAAWLGPAGAGSWYENGQAVNLDLADCAFIQYRLALGAAHSGRTPRVRSVEVTLC